MKKTITITGVAIILALVFLLQTPKEVKGEMTVYMGENCRCCDIYADIMSRNYDVEKKVLSNSEFNELKLKRGVPKDLASCHTTIVDNYLIEGHIPMEAIEKLRNENKNIHGIGMKGMPAGSPGMGGVKSEDFKIYKIPEKGEKGNLFMKL